MKLLMSPCMMMIPYFSYLFLLLVLLLRQSVHQVLSFSIHNNKHNQRRPTTSRRPRSPLFSSTTTTTTSTTTSTLSTADLASTTKNNYLPWNSLVGEADRAFRYGVQLEKNGQARKASAAFHEAATLYQCFLDSTASSSSNNNSFAHVTSLLDKDVSVILAYTCCRLGFLNVDALGDAKAAVRLYKFACAIDPLPSATSYHGLGTSLEASCSAGEEKLQEALNAYDKALELSSSSGGGGQQKILFQRAVALERLGKVDEANEIFEKLRRDESVYACLVDSWGYVRWHTRKVLPTTNRLNLYRGTRDMLEIALDAAMPLIEQQQGGLVCEFGVGGGKSLRMTQEILPLDVPIHGFDTFTGLPMAWGNEPAGTYSTGGIVPNLEGEVYFHKGLFRDTIPPFLEQAGKDAFLAYANVDCDLYSSTLDVLEAFYGRVVVGTILVFDEYIGHPTWRQDEFRAWRESCKHYGWKYEYLAFSLSTNQAVVRVTDA